VHFVIFCSDIQHFEWQVVIQKMEGGTVQFIIFLLIIIVIKESLVEAVSLEATPTELAKSGDTITLTWKDMTTPSDLDWLGIYTPPESTDDHFIGYILLSSCKGWESGMGTYEFVALNMRAPYEFRLFKGYPPDAETHLDEDKNPLPSTKLRLAVSPTVRFHHPNQPTQLHLSLTSNMSEMRVMFVTKDPLRSFVQYGRNADNLHLSVEALSQTYQQSDMCAAPANSAIGWRDPGFIHTALLHELDSGARYFYKVKSCLHPPFFLYPPSFGSRYYKNPEACMCICNFSQSPMLLDVQVSCISSLRVQSTLLSFSASLLVYFSPSCNMEFYCNRNLCLRISLGQNSGEGNSPSVCRLCVVNSWQYRSL
jgi:hypothetical protein